MLTLGIDFDSYALHVCGLPDDGGPPVVQSEPIRKRGDDEHRAMMTVAQALAVATNKIGMQIPVMSVIGGGGTVVAQPRVAISSVWIERGYGASRRADFVLGAIYGATFIAVAHVLPGVPARPMQARDWKRDLTGEMGITTKTGGRGNGNVKKEVANACARELWEREWPLAIIPTDPNQLDAFSIAWAASRL